MNEKGPCNAMCDDSITENIYTVRLEEGARRLHIGASSVIGRRAAQQDAIKADDDYAYAENECAIAVLCDGMGGLAEGEKASALCASLLYDAFHQVRPLASVPQFFESVIALADEEVCALPSDAGTTLASVIIEENRLFWASVGDSRVYFIRGGAIRRMTTDHNLYMLLSQKVERGELTQEEANAHAQKEALVSYVGMGRIRYLDSNENAFLLQDGDIVLLCSDGLYRSLTDEEICRAVCRRGQDTQLAADDLTRLAMSKQNKHQDNTSVIVIGFEDSG